MNPIIKYNTAREINAGVYFFLWAGIPFVTAVLFDTMTAIVIDFVFQIVYPLWYKADTILLAHENSPSICRLSREAILRPGGSNSQTTLHSFRQQILTRYMHAIFETIASSWHY